MQQGRKGGRQVASKAKGNKRKAQRKVKYAPTQIPIHATRHLLSVFKL